MWVFLWATLLYPVRTGPLISAHCKLFEVFRYVTIYSATILTITCIHIWIHFTSWFHNTLFSRGTRTSDDKTLFQYKEEFTTEYSTDYKSVSRHPANNHPVPLRQESEDSNPVIEVCFFVRLFGCTAVLSSWYVELVVLCQWIPEGGTSTIRGWASIRPLVIHKETTTNSKQFWSFSPNLV